MIEAFYNLSGLPFDKASAFENIFASAAASELLARLAHLQQCRGMMLLTGESGSGKTTVVHHFVHKLHPASYHVIYLPLSTVSATDFYRQICRELTGNAPYRKSDLYRCAQAAIQDLVQNKKHIPVIVFDEAHLLVHQTLMELPILCNFQMDSIDPAIVILIGHPHLRQRLEQHIYLSLYRRIVVSFAMPFLAKDECQAFIEHHLALKKRKTPTFSEAAYHAIFQNTAGSPALIVRLVLKTLLLGTQQKIELLSEEQVFLAAKEL
jgi:type II secretory pathway predicted ATPase ExeA